MRQVNFRSATGIRHIYIPFAGSVLILFMIVSAAQAQHTSTPETWQLSKVEVSGLQRYGQDQIIALSGLRAGQSIDEAAIVAAAGRLSNTGLFKKVSYRYRSLSGQVDVTFLVEEVKWGMPVVFDNFIWFSDKEIINEISKEIPTFDGTAPEADKIIDNITRILNRLLLERNITGQVEYTPSAELSGRNREHIFSVKDLKVPVCSVQFPGAAAVQQKELMNRSKLLLSGEYSRNILKGFIKDTFLPVYLERGYLHARFNDPMVKTDSAHNCKNGVTVILPVEEGPGYLWEKAEWSGNEAFSAQELESLLAMKTGEPANGLKIAAGLKSLRQVYGKKGFVTAKLTATPDFDDKNQRVVYRISINEGPQYKMGELIFTGLSESNAKSLKKKWKLQPGSVYDVSYLEEFGKKALTSNASGSGAKAVRVAIKPDGQRLTVDVHIEFQ